MISAGHVDNEIIKVWEMTLDEICTDSLDLHRKCLCYWFLLEPSFLHPYISMFLSATEN